jgi:cardiolipin synthase
MKLKKILNTITGRIVITVAAIALQLFWLFYSIYSLSLHNQLINIALLFLSLLVLIYIINSNSSPEVKLAWAVPILMFPILGGVLFFISGGKGPRKKLSNAIMKQQEKTVEQMPDSAHALHEIQDRRLVSQSQYLVNRNFPVYQNTATKYFPNGMQGYEALCADLKKAKRFIFLEYFIITPGKMWDGIFDILKEKASHGVNVRVMYDDIGSVSSLPIGFDQTLRNEGIQALPFNPFVPFCSVIMNNRDHRKIAVIDGNVAYTGGCNIADEYINEIEKYGYWKDNMIRLEGEGVWSMTSMFLELWDACLGVQDDYSIYKPTCFEPCQGFVQPYWDSPLDHEYLGENVYLNMINSATKSVCIMTPYLIIDSVMNTALCLAAKRGVDVTIITPGIPDKKMVWDLTRSHYPQLLEANVHIYEYTPGFLHSKVCICDDEVAVTGTINMDYRSLYLHFENACLIMDENTIADIRADFDETLSQSRNISLPDLSKKMKRMTLFHSIYYALLRLFAPLL